MSEATQTIYVSNIAKKLSTKQVGSKTDVPTPKRDTQQIRQYGYSKEFVVERLYRDAPLLVIGEGTNEVQRLIIAKRLIEQAAG